jgi:hypothetical protein
MCYRMAMAQRNVYRGFVILNCVLSDGYGAAYCGQRVFEFELCVIGWI